MIHDIMTCYGSGLAFGALIGIAIYGLKYVIALFRILTK